MSVIAVKHNMEVAHRLSLTPGKCENIHGHSMWVTLYLRGAVDDKGMLEGIDYGPLKRRFRSYLDGTYDHRVVLHEEDPWAMFKDAQGITMPGLLTLPVDPTTENLAMIIGQDMAEVIPEVFKCEVWETSVNMATWYNRKNSMEAL